PLIQGLSYRRNSCRKKWLELVGRQWSPRESMRSSDLAEGRQREQIEAEPSSAAGTDAERFDQASLKRAEIRRTEVNDIRRNVRVAARAQSGRTWHRAAGQRGRRDHAGDRGQPPASADLRRALHH